jgi:NADH-quinone oxidoreductase subunit M
MAEFGGLAHNMKVYAAMTMVMVLSSVGLPLLNGFVGEFWILAGAFHYDGLMGAIGALGVVLGAVYLLSMYQRVFYGPLEREENKGLSDLNDREIYALIPLVVLVFWIGIFPTTFTSLLDSTTKQTVHVVENQWQREGGLDAGEVILPRDTFVDPSLEALADAGVESLR